MYRLLQSTLIECDLSKMCILVHTVTLYWFNAVCKVTATLDLQVVKFVATCNLLRLYYDAVCHCAVWRQPELMNTTEMKQNVSEELVFSDKNDLESYKVLCAPPVTNQTWQMASGYIGAVLMLVMAVYARYDNSCTCAVVKDGIHYPTYPCTAHGPCSRKQA